MVFSAWRKIWGNIVHILHDNVWCVSNTDVMIFCVHLLLQALYGELSLDFCHCTAKQQVGVDTVEDEHEPRSNRFIVCWIARDAFKRHGDIFLRIPRESTADAQTVAS